MLFFYLQTENMIKRSNHVVSSKSGGWSVKKSGSARASKVFGTKEQAKNYGIEISRKERTVLYIHMKDGTIQNRNSYGQDPFPSRNSRN